MGSTTRIAPKKVSVGDQPLTAMWAPTSLLTLKFAAVKQGTADCPARLTCIDSQGRQAGAAEVMLLTNTDTRLVAFGERGPWHLGDSHPPGSQHL